MTESDPARTKHHVVVAGITAAFATFGVVAFWLMPLESLLRDFSCDDSYYFARIAQELATSGLSSFDGRTETNGYQPLWTWLEVPLFWLVDDPVVALRWLRSIEVTLVLLGCLLWMATLWRVGVNAWPTLLLVLSMVKSHALFLGMEAGTSIAMLGLAAYCTVRLVQANPKARSVWALVCGIAMVAAAMGRLDNLAFTAPVCGWLVLQRPAYHLRARALLWLLVPQLALLAVYFVGNAIAFDTAVPVSGLVKQWWSSMSPDAGLERWLRRLCALLGTTNARDGIVFALALAALHWHRTRRALAPPYVLAPLVVGLLALAVVKVGYYATTVEPELASYGWYFVSGALTKTLAIILLVDRLWHAAVTKWPASQPTLAAIMVVTVVALGLRQIDRYRGYVTRTQPDWEILSYRGAQWLAANLPHAVRVASYDAGVLGYFAPQPVTNLDGLVNSVAYLEAQKRGQSLLEYLRSQKIRYLANVFPSDLAEPRLRGTTIGAEGDFEVLFRSEAAALVDGAKRRMFVLSLRD